MREQKIDVEMTVTRDAVVLAHGFEHCMDEIFRYLRNKADEQVQAIGGTLRATSQPEIVVSEAISPILGDVFVVATRWLCDVPESAYTPAER